MNSSLRLLLLGAAAMLTDVAGAVALAWAAERVWCAVRGGVR